MKVFEHASQARRRSYELLVVIFSNLCEGRIFRRRCELWKALEVDCIRRWDDLQGGIDVVDSRVDITELKYTTTKSCVSGFT